MNGKKKTLSINAEGSHAVAVKTLLLLHLVALVSLIIWGIVAIWRAIL